jgi:hypothetical protein
VLAAAGAGGGRGKGKGKTPKLVTELRDSLQVGPDKRVLLCIDNTALSIHCLTGPHGAVCKSCLVCCCCCCSQTLYSVSWSPNAVALPTATATAPRNVTWLAFGGLAGFVRCIRVGMHG